MTVTEAVTAYARAHGAGWSNARYAKQWLTALEQHVLPGIGDVSVSKRPNPERKYMQKSHHQLLPRHRRSRAGRAARGRSTTAWRTGHWTSRRHGPGRRRSPPRPPSSRTAPSGGEQTLAGLGHPSQLDRFLPGGRQAHPRIRTQAEIVPSAVTVQPLHPATRTGRCHDQHQASNASTVDAMTARPSRSHLSIRRNPHPRPHAVTHM